MDICVDSCVVIDRIGLLEPGHALAVEFFRVLKERRDLAHVAYTVKWEMLAVVNHPKIGPPEGSLDPDLRQMFRFIPIDGRLDVTLFHGVRSPVRGADLVMLACARFINAPLITRDRRILDYSKDYGVRSLSPRQYIDGELDLSP